MIDITSSAVRAISERGASAVPLAFVAGAAVSIGPCVAPRFLTIAALTARKSLPQCTLIVGTFMAGLAAAYILLAMSGSLLWRLVAYSNYFYLTIAAVMAGSGLVTLARRDAACSHPPDAGRSLGATFLLGASSAVTVSPCCFPVILAAATYAGTAGSVLTAETAGAFALGHSAPLFFAAGTLRPVLPMFSRAAVSRATQVIAASLMLALAAFYGILA